SAFALQIVSERFASERLGHHEGPPLHFADAQNLDDVRVAKPHEKLGFPAEARVALFALSGVGREQFDDDRLTGGEVFGEVEARGRTFVDESLDLEASADDCPGHSAQAV